MLYALYTPPVRVKKRPSLYIEQQGRLLKFYKIGSLQ